MRKGYKLAKWSRQAETLHRKAVALAEEIEAVDGEYGEYTCAAQEVSTSAHQLAYALEKKETAE